MLVVYFHILVSHLFKDNLAGLDPAFAFSKCVFSPVFLCF